MKPKKTSIGSRPFKVSAKTVFVRKTYRTLLFASVCNGHCIHLRHRIEPHHFSVDRPEPWPTKAVITHITTKRLRRERDIHQRASARKPSPSQMTATTDHKNQA